MMDDDGDEAIHESPPPAVLASRVFINGSESPLNTTAMSLQGSIMTDLPYVPGTSNVKPEPLSRYLPPLPEGVVTEWLRAYLPQTPGNPNPAWILDPFGATPRIAVEAAWAGYRVLVAANNPIARFLLEMSANPPSQDDLRAVLADLAATRKGDERIEPHIRSLYFTFCEQCGNEIEAQAFIWERGESYSEDGNGSQEGHRLIARIYQCPHCQASGEFPASQLDQTRADQFATGSLHRARALERVAAVDDPDRHHVEEALSVYLPRAVYAVFTLINKLDGMHLSPERRNQLVALLLSVCDQANTLWAYPTGRARPRALTISPKFRENNVWLSLEQSISQWATGERQVPVTTWPDPPPETGGISIYEGRLKDLVTELGEVPIQGVITALPRPNQAFWTLSALWAGWLWGRKALGPFKSVLRRRRYDWAWHTSALTAAFENLTLVLREGTPVFGLIGEQEPGYLSAAIIAADIADLELQGLAMPVEGGHAQISWKWQKQSATLQPPAQDQTQQIRNVAKAYLQARGEPSHYLSLHAAILEAQAREHALGSTDLASMELLSQFNTIVEQALLYRGGFLRLGGSEKSIEVGHWWLREFDSASISLSDQVEMELVRYLITHPGESPANIYRHLYATFPGLLTPSSELIHLCLASYAVESPEKKGTLKINVQDTPASRRKDLADILTKLKTAAKNLDFRPDGDNPQIWQDETGETIYAWFVTASAVIGEHLFKKDYPPTKSILAIPGGRANLAAYKTQHDPRLRQAVEEGWRFVKFRQIRWLINNPIVSKQDFDNWLAQDTITYESPQMRLF